MPQKAAKGGTISTISLPKNLPRGLPAVFDDMSFALSLGIRNKTVWWLIHATKIENLESGRGSYQVFNVPKKRGGFRVIHAPLRTLKNVQRVLMQVYFNKLPVGDWVGAYVRGRDMVYSVNKHTGRDVVLSLDLTNFFGSTKRAWVRDWIRSLGYAEEVVIPMSNLVTVPVRRGKYTSYVVPQGAPTSGVVTNHVASVRLDIPLLEFLSKAGLRDVAYTRYADDLTISYNGFLPKEEFEVLMAGIREVVSASGYRLNNSKTRVCVSNPAQPVPQRMLGMTVNEKVNIPREKRRLLRARVHRACTNPHLFDKTIDTLRAELAYWVRIAPATIQPLIDKMTWRFQ